MNMHASSERGVRMAGLSFVKILGGMAAGLARVLTWPFGPTLGPRAAGYAASLMPPVVKVRTQRGDIRFWCPSYYTARRATRFLAHEPATRAWIEETIKPGEH